MKLREITTKIVIDHRKITEYALNIESPRGKDKALMFKLHLGYTKHNYKKLKQQIEDKILDADVTKTIFDSYGQRYQIDLEIEGINEQQKEIVRTGWIIEPNQDFARLTTLYIRSKK